MYYIVYGFLWLISLLPLRILYFLADGIYGLVFYILKYRKQVALKNLSIAFPEKTEEERMQIAKKFYRNLIDTFVETIKMISVSKNFYSKRFKGNWDVLNALKSSGKSIQLHMGHNFNWEWGNATASPQFTIPFIGVYMPVTNKIFDKLFYNLRSANGTIMIKATKMQEEFLPYKNTQYILGLAADQNPGNPTSAWWFNFFNTPTPFVKGPAKAAINNNTAVVFAFIHKPRRGYYEVIFSLVEKEANVLNEIELTKKFVHYLEGVIRQYPDMWLWTHRRWKWEWKPEYGAIID
jgi:KDO2-lipid IV(A) lauroyltransferase